MRPSTKPAGGPPLAGSPVSQKPPIAKFISCDWGSSRFRLRLVQTRENRVLASMENDRGSTVIAGEVAPHSNPEARESAFARAMASAIETLAAKSGEALEGLPAIVSGMATSAHGWRELAYAPLPFDLHARKTVFAHFPSGDPPRDIYMLSGLRAERDVMRGEETEAVGLFSLPEYADRADDCTVVTPGTHSKHIRIRNRRIDDFRTCLTGELYDILTRHSVLRFGLEQPEGRWGDIDETLEGQNCGNAFDEGVNEARRGSLIGDVFKVRVRGLLGSHTRAENAEYLSGLLIGSELKDLLAFHPHGPVILCAASRLSARYARAFACLGESDRVEVVPPETVETLALRGHAVFLSQHIETNGKAKR